MEIAQLGGPPDADTAAAVHKLVVQRFIEMMLREEVSSHCMLRLANSYRITAQAQPSGRKSADTEAWTKVLRAVMSLPPTLAELEEAAQKSNHPAPESSSDSPQPSAGHSGARPLVRESLLAPFPTGRDRRGGTQLHESSSRHPAKPAPSADPRTSEVAAKEFKKLMLDRVRPRLDDILDQREAIRNLTG